MGHIEVDFPSRKIGEVPDLAFFCNMRKNPKEVP